MNIRPHDGTRIDGELAERIDDDHREPSPSTDWRELYHINGVAPPDEPCTYPPETLARMERTARRHDHVRFL